MNLTHSIGNNIHDSKNENINIWISQIESDYKLAMSVDCVIFGYTEADLYVALINCNMPPYEGKLSLVGDLLKDTEDLESSAYRIVKQRTGLENVYLEQVQSFSKIGRHPLGRVVTTAFYSLLKIDDYKKLIPKNCPLVWKKVNEVCDLAFDHDEIFEVCLSKLRKQMKEHPVGFNLLPMKFTLNQLQQLYEVVLGIEFDKRNFRRKLKNLDIIKDEKETEKDVPHRPAKLYSFDVKKYETNNSLVKLA
jgi:8-oxo-dGTP diphosphatase